jgi:hypothetical protein
MYPFPMDQDQLTNTFWIKVKIRFWMVDLDFQLLYTSRPYFNLLKLSMEVSTLSKVRICRRLSTQEVKMEGFYLRVPDGEAF